MRIAIDVPTLSLPQAFTTASPGGPIWSNGVPAGTVAHVADNGFYAQSTIGDNYTTRGPHNRAPWEPDGTPAGEGGHYGIYNGTDPEASYRFNLAVGTGRHTVYGGQDHETEQSSRFVIQLCHT